MKNNYNSPWADTFFWLHSGDKTLYGFLVTSELVAFAQKWGILQTRMDQREDHIKMNFDYFQI